MPPRLPKSSLPKPAQIPTTSPLLPHFQCLNPTKPRSFSSTPSNGTRQRRTMYRWLHGPGAVFKDPLPGSTNYLNAYDGDGNLIRLRSRPQSDEKKGSEEGIEGEAEMNIAGSQRIPMESADDLVPFPLNKQFKSQSVLCEELKDEIYRRVVQKGQSVRVVSAEMGVEMARVGAVVRLKTIEYEWIKQNKPLATPYARAILAMLPQTTYAAAGSIRPHESINDLPVHRATLSQIFHPVSESRAFTRTDAGIVFSPRCPLLPADARIPHPELIDLEKDRLMGMEREERLTRQRERMRTQTEEKEERERRVREKQERATNRIQGPRCIFQFEDVSVESVGKTGRDKRGVGARYGFPHEDRKRAQIKIPTRVD